LTEFRPKAAKSASPEHLWQNWISHWCHVLVFLDVYCKVPNPSAAAVAPRSLEEPLFGEKETAARQGRSGLAAYGCRVAARTQALPPEVSPSSWTIIAPCRAPLGRLPNAN